MLENTETVHGTSITNEIKVEDKIAIAGSLSLEEQSKKRWDNVKILTDQIIDLSNNYGFDAGRCLQRTMCCGSYGYQAYYQEIIDRENGRQQRLKNGETTENKRVLVNQIIDLSNNYGFDARCCLNLTMTCCNKEYYQEIIDTENGRLQRVKNDGLSVETGLQS